MPPASIRKSPLDQKITEAGGPSPLNVLAVCGETLRRSKQTSSARPEETERALAALSLADVNTALASVDVTSAKGELTRAFEDAFEAAFADGDEERAMFAGSAMSSLASCDRIASTLTAARARLALDVPVDDGGARATLTATVDGVEARFVALGTELAGGARSLTAVNPERRAELAKLDPEFRGSAWWYGSRCDVGDDELLVVLGGATPTRPLEALSEATSADLAGSALVPVDAGSALRRTAMGQSLPRERAWLESRSKSDGALGKALELAHDREMEKEEAAG